MTLKERFYEKVALIPFHSCWEWVGNRKLSGYGRIDFQKKSYLAHRLSWEIHRGEVPRGMFVCHKCDNPSCVNPDHLFIGSHQENMDDMRRKGRCRRISGVAHYKAKLQEKQIVQIRNSDMSSRRLAVIFGVSHHNILSIKNRKTWKHL